MQSTKIIFTAVSLLITASVLGSESRWVDKIESPQYFAVSVEDVERAVSWYRSVFGLEMLDEASAEDGAWRIVNLERDGLFVELIYDRRDAPKSRSRGIAKVGFRVADVRTVADRVEKATGDRPRVLDFSRHGVRLLQLRDPEDNVIQLTSPLEEAVGEESSTSTSDPGGELMALAMQALGGEGRRGVRTLRAVADCTRGESEFVTEVLSHRPDRTVFAQRSADGAMEMWVQGDTGFLLDPDTGERQPLTEPQRQMARGHEFHFLLFDLDQRFGKLHRIGGKTVTGRACTAVSAEDENGRPAEICFDDVNHLPLALTYEPPGGGGITLTIVFERWREIDDVQYVSAFSLHQGEELFTYRYHTIEPNAVLEEHFGNRGEE